MCLCYLFGAKNCMTTSESKDRFFLQNESIRIDSLNESNRIDSNREFEYSTVNSTTAWPGLCFDHLIHPASKLDRH